MKPEKACLLYFRPGPGLEVSASKIPSEDVYSVYLFGSKRSVRHAVETLVKSLRQWLDDPENGGFEADVYSAGDQVFAHQVAEGSLLFNDQEGV